MTPVPSQDEVKVTLQGGRVVSARSGASVAELVRELGIPGFDQAVVARLNGAVVDLSAPVIEDATLTPVDMGSELGLETCRHSSAHLMAQAVRRLFGGVQLGTGPAIADGFYYDFLVEKPFVPEDLPRIEEEMKKIVAENHAVRRRMVSRDEARAIFKGRGEGLKLELIEAMEFPEVSVYEQGEFVDLCRGPHVPATGRLGNFKLLSTAGTNWRGDETQVAMQRIYGTAWKSPEELELYLARLAQARERDHRKLGPALGLFTIEPDAGAGLIFWHPKGVVLRSLIEEYWRREHTARGYQIVMTPHLGRANQWVKSGHFSFYKENLFVVRGEKRTEEEFVVKPMNCIGHIHIYKSRLRSYRELPVRIAEMGTVYRRERPSVLHGLLRVRGFTQDDAHIFAKPEDLESEIAGVVDLVIHMMKVFGFEEFAVELSAADPLRPADYAGEREKWEWAEAILARVLDGMGLSYVRREGEAAFYGPKIDFQLLDALGRKWQGPTVQLDFNQPERFDVTYVGKDGARHRALMVHRVVLGSMERFIGALIEHHAGVFPLWIAPVQATVLPVSEETLPYGEKVVSELEARGVRAELDRTDDKIGMKIRRAEMSKVPYMLVVGRREAEAGAVAVRRHGTGDQGARPVADFIAAVEEEVRARR